ncbi:MAG: tRNA 2-thiouridine(34) synthase MnmA [Phycisphaerales bacterium JB039]
MSGGVDSSVAAATLVRDGWEVIGCFMRLGSPGEEIGRARLDGACDGAREGGVGEGEGGGEEGPSRSGGVPKPVRIGKQGCCSVGDAADARQVAAELGVPLYVCNFKRDFGRIIDYFVDEYASGRTPNPCVRCNDWLKFGKLHEYARQVGATHVASGHYARIDHSGAQPRLMRARDAAKDQSYVLFGIPREQLGSTLLPVGEFEDKGAVRDEARRLGLPVFDKPDSYEICFVPGNDYAAFVEQRRPELRREGRIIDTASRELGRHEGQHRFTIGQRRGTGVALGLPAYVVGRDPEANTVTLGGTDDLMTERIEVGEVNWLVDHGVFTEWQALEAQYRAHGAPARCRVRRVADSAGPTPSGRRGRLEVRFDEPQRAVAPGQALALYDKGGALVAGGWIA